MACQDHFVNLDLGALTFDGEVRKLLIVVKTGPVVSLRWKEKVLTLYLPLQGLVEALNYLDTIHFRWGKGKQVGIC